MEKHCIKTEFKKKYEKNLSLCLKGKGSKELELELEALKGALEKNDLVSIRGKYSQLRGKTKDIVSFFFDEKEKYLLINKSVRVDLK